MASRQIGKRLSVSGEKEIVKNLREEISKIRGDVTIGLRFGMLHIKGDAQEIAPVEFGVLVNSAFSQVVSTGLSVLARVGFTAKYAPFVHEMPNDTNWTKPGTGNKFLEKAVFRNLPELLKLIKKHAKR